jgi:tetratricopeptide (TPR) repeat protein
LNIPAKDQLKASRFIGKQKYDQAIDLISKGLTGSKEDVPMLCMIAMCHHWAGRDEEAIETANRVLAFEPDCFDAAELLSRIHFSRSEFEQATKYARLGIEHFPEPLPEPPSLSIFIKFAGLFFPRLKQRAETARRYVSETNASRSEWKAWAEKYLEWQGQSKPGFDL